MFIKKLFLLLAGMLLLLGYLLLPQNLEWCKNIRAYWRDFNVQKDQPGRETRFEKRFGREYILSRQIARQFERDGNKPGILVLMPPTSYFQKHRIAYHVPEPAVFYYFTGLKTIWANSPKAIDANWYVHVKDGKIIVDSVVDKRSLGDTIDVFKKMGVTL